MGRIRGHVRTRVPRVSWTWNPPSKPAESFHSSGGWSKIWQLRQRGAPVEIRTTWADVIKLNSSRRHWGEDCAQPTKHATPATEWQNLQAQTSEKKHLSRSPDTVLSVVRITDWRVFFLSVQQQNLLQKHKSRHRTSYRAYRGKWKTGTH